MDLLKLDNLTDLIGQTHGYTFAPKFALALAETSEDVLDWFGRIHRRSS
ncbi:MAG TPA: hypothetical protein VGJ82_04710 [Thermoanaerobaculia bacterium]|jgi:hypothetical protein